jgi:hypothetical protein
MEKARDEADHREVEGWGADLDPGRRPATPKERMPARLPGLHWDRVAMQPVTVEVLHSNERPGLTPVFGTTLPPSGLSGVIRRRAFRHSENDLRHWLTLLAADRVDAVEGIFDDVRRSPRSPYIAAGLVLAGFAWYLLRPSRGARAP